MGLDNPLHIFILLVILLLVFGAKRLPELGRSLGHGMRGFKESISGESSTGDGYDDHAPALASSHVAVAEAVTEPASVERAA
jgi:sec-independent protein translocase protein TatA